MAEVGRESGPFAALGRIEAGEGQFGGGPPIATGAMSVDSAQPSGK